MRNKSAVYRGIRKQGFTFIELLVVVIIVGIFLAIALPVFTKNIEKSKTGEAITTLNLIRMAEKDYFLDNNIYTSDISKLIIDDTSLPDGSNRYFDYTILPGAGANNFTAKAARRDGPYGPSGTGDYYTIDKDGAIDSSNGHFIL
ncbi:MAG: prepilin-type N-terminal cleavage/methylation domain-containing protein [Candidatus Omnitrophota bacterium]|nr:prepilin-type N-terminal cleavage/methylation domain-containing protein [Candidatus Omnitrophota bacterium]